MAEETGQSLEEIGTTTARPPWVSVPMGARSPGAPSSPPSVPRHPRRHRELRQHHVGGRLAARLRLRQPRAEALAVHDAAGLIDVSTLGKLIS